MKIGLYMHEKGLIHPSDGSVDQTSARRWRQNKRPIYEWNETYACITKGLYMNEKRSMYEWKEICGLIQREVSMKPVHDWEQTYVCITWQLYQYKKWYVESYIYNLHICIYIYIHVYIYI